MLCLIPFNPVLETTMYKRKKFDLDLLSIEKLISFKLTSFSATHPLNWKILFSNLFSVSFQTEICNTNKKFQTFEFAFFCPLYKNEENQKRHLYAQSNFM